MTNAPLWQGRIAGPPDPAFFAFQRSLPYDARLLPQDLAVNRAWARALGRAGLLPAEDVARLEAALAAIGELGFDPPPRILITGSLYLAGEVLAANGTEPV